MTFLATLHFSSIKMVISSSPRLRRHDSPFTKQEELDEKWFVLLPSPNLQTTAFGDPEEEKVCWFQGDSKVMAWVVLVDGTALTVRWMEDKQGCPASVTG